MELSTAVFPQALAPKAAPPRFHSPHPRLPLSIPCIAIIALTSLQVPLRLTLGSQPQGPELVGSFGDEPNFHPSSMNFMA